MWIAKPLAQLEPEELEQWRAVLDHHQKSEQSAPLSQSLAWASAMASVGGEPFVVFNPHQQVGGLLMRTPSSEGFHVECINGPLLSWDDPEAAPRQLATFALGASKLSNKFRGLKISPRWPQVQAEARLKNLPVEPHSSQGAATWRSPTDSTGLSRRLRRTIRTTLQWAHASSSDWQPASESRLGDFVPKMQSFGSQKNFYVPELRWFLGLLGKDVRLWLATARAARGADHAEAQHLVAEFQSKAHYLFGFQLRTPGAPSRVSAAALCHERTLDKLSALGIAEYDFNGYLSAPTPEDPYAGVCEFKRQFGGESVEYFSPTFHIEA